MGIYQEKQHLYREYLKELDKYRKTPWNLSESEANQLCDTYISSTKSSWHNIFVDGNLVGFVIMGKEPPLRHPDAVRSVAEAYILPVYRRKGLVKQTISEYIGRHPGIYSINILHKNDAAIEAFQDIFRSVGYQATNLATKALQSSEDSIILGFCPR